MIDKFWKKYFEPRIQGMITRRILLFHQAMIDRGQIPEPPITEAPRVTACCTAVDSSAEYRSQYPSGPAPHPQQP